MRLLKRKQEVPKQFTGTCYVREYTADGFSVGACYHPTYDGQCPRHGDVMDYLSFAAGDPRRAVKPWPADYNLPKHDGEAWAERLRARQANHKKGNGS